MSTRKQPTNFVQRLLKRVWRSFNVLFKTLLNGVLRGLRVNKRRSRQSQAGFVLPTVVMVLLVVALLTTAIVIRSFDRAKNASNFRVDQAVLNAATPAIDRAKAKLERLLSPDENRLAGSPPGEGKLSTDTGTISYVLSQPQYTFGDETQLKLVYNNPNADPPNDPAKQTLETVWKFPVDTDNNGKFDTFTLYGIYFRNPPVDENNNPERARTPVEARAVPQATGAGSNCEASSGGSASGTNGWYQTDGQLKKAFFVYVANVPIAQLDINQLPAAGQTKYEVYKGNKGFSALEMQEDQARISLDNNAVWYDDDLVISNVPTFRVNGRVHTNSNLMVAGAGEPIVFRQVSALQSCFYTGENGLITVGGNVVAGDVSRDSPSGSSDVQVHRYQRATPPGGTNPATNPSIINNSTTTVTDPAPNQVASNSGAYDKRLKLLVKEALALHPAGDVTPTTIAGIGRYPQEEVKNEFTSKYAGAPASGRSILTQVLTSYFAKRIRRVSYKEVRFENIDGTTPNPYNPLTNPPAAGAALPDPNSIDPPLQWMSQVPTATTPPQLLEPDPNISTRRLAATNPPDLELGRNLVQNAIGDRILVGNALPTEWLKTNASPDTYAKKGDQQDIPGETFSPNGQRWRKSQVQQLDDLGDTSRGGFWEQAAAYSGNAAKNYQELAGGLRVVTGAGIYIDDNEPTNSYEGTGKRVSDLTAVGETSRRSFLPVPPTVAELQNIGTSGNPNYDANGVRLPTEIQGVTGTELLKYKVVWPDTMPMFRWDKRASNTTGLYDWGSGEVKRGDLQMRATVVYHYNTTGVPPTQPVAPEDSNPIACIATYYDPTNELTAQNVMGLTQLEDQKTRLADGSVNNFGTSINGVNYPYAILPSLRRAAPNLTILRRQGNMIFPNGRWVNQPLRDAIKKIDANQELALNDIAAIDAANCALTILYGASPQANSLVEDGAIQERTFLDARQIKAIHKRDTDKAGALLTHSDGTLIRKTLLEDITNPAKLKIAELGSLTTQYSLPIEQRQPLEIRVTQINLDKLRGKPVGTGTGSGITSTQEYMLPNTGIIYATRDDAIADASDPEGGSATDFKLDPTRRPNGIRLVKGENLARENDYRLVEKGLILASDLPVYIKGPFNLHVAPGTTTLRSEFRTRPDFYTGSDPDPDFACRPGSCPSGSTTGDQWRPARILADAVTLLSKDFRDGYRNEGDFDLNNNSGNLAVETRLKNGFWWNSFATSAEWYAADGFPDLDKATAGKQLSSYVTNGVTPIQRRIPLLQGGFPAYKMEICEKFPVSACGATDWKQAGAGTTAAYYANTPTTDPRYVDLGKRVFPRRVAFKRNQFGQLIPGDEACTPATATSPGTCKATPIGAAGQEVSYGTTAAPAGSAAPAADDNALWYVTTRSNADPSAGISYNKINNLYYPPFDTEAVSERQLLLPGMPESLTQILKLLQIWDAATPSLNGTTAEDTPDYAIYSYAGTNCYISTAYKATDPGTVNPAACPVNAATGIGNLWAGLRSTGLTSSILPVVSVQPLVIPAPTVAGARIPLPLKATAKLNIYDLPLDSSATGKGQAVLSNLDITLDRNSQDDPIFVFRTEQNMDFQLPVTIKLEGVDPNNIFWVSKLGTRIVYDPANNVAPKVQHQLVGNFIGGNDGVFLVTDSDTPDTYTQTTDPITTPLIQGGRILGFNKTYPTYPIPAGVMTALTTTDQPLVMPVLQLHSPQGLPLTNATATVNNEQPFGTDTINADYWIQRVPTGTPEQERMYNAVFIMGDSPSRPLSPTTGESGGGLPNFPRFLEAWEDTHPTDDNAGAKAANDIKGSFIQFKKSAFATAPFEAIDDPTQDNSLFFDSLPGQVPAYMTGFSPASGNPYIYKGGGQGRKAPYYRPPIREWGYDVGLLSQTPDLFSRRFANPTVGTPNQYFRQVNRNDPWIETLLCAAQPASGGTGYQRAIADPKERPSNCPPLTDFN